MRTLVSWVSALLLVMTSTEVGLGQQAVFRSSATSIVVDVSVRDGRTPVVSLQTDELELMDNGVRQVIQLFSRSRVPLDITLLVDASVSMSRSIAGSLAEARASASWTREAFQQITAAIRDGDHVEAIRLNTFTQRMSSDAIQLSTPAEAETRQGRTALLDGIATMLMLPSVPDRRRAIIALTDGRDTASVIGAALHREIADHADATVFIVALGGREWHPPGIQFLGRTWADGYEQVITDYVARTGGQLFSLKPSDPVEQQLADLLEELRTRYTIVYTPTGVSRTGWHEIKVTAKSKKYVVRARRGYWAG
jgi:VWFA-related protein